jgi:deferrochelatase/peroxidase EfeB
MKRLQSKAAGLAYRALFASALALTLVAGQALAQTSNPQSVTANWGAAQDPNQAELFWGEHQAGIDTKPQHFIYFAVFDLTTSKREDVVRLFKAWTAASSRMTQGETAQPLESGLQLAVPPAPPTGEDADAAPDPGKMAADSGEALEMPAARLTITFGFGSGLFVKAGKDRFGLASRRPEALVDMPTFGAIDQISEMNSGGDLAIQACAEDPQIAFHAIRQLARLAQGVAQIRWVQLGYRPMKGDRHLLGFSAEEKNPTMNAPQAQTVWVGSEGPEWMRGGSYVVVRRVRFALEHWDSMPQAYQEQAIGETKHHARAAESASPSPSPSPENSLVEEHPAGHLSVVAQGRDAMLRRSYSYNDGVNFISERWPPWRQGLEYDAGMFFICFQHDPRTGFIEVFDEMAKRDYKLNQFWTHVASGLFAIPRGASQGEYIGQPLFEAR